MCMGGNDTKKVMLEIQIKRSGGNGCGDTGETRTSWRTFEIQNMVCLITPTYRLWLRHPGSQGRQLHEPFRKKNGHSIESEDVQISFCLIAAMPTIQKKKTNGCAVSKVLGIGMILRIPVDPTLTFQLYDHLFRKAMISSL